MNVRKRLSSFVTLLFCGMIVSVPAEPAASVPAKPASTYPCTNDFYRAGTHGQNISVATGVLATIRTPTPGQVYGYESPRAVATDIYMSRAIGGSGFVQAGWYLGYIPGLPYTSQPRFWWAENTPSGEAVHAGTLLSWGTYYKFMITNPLDGTNKFNIWLQDNLVDQTDYGHDLDRPNFNGEVNYKCTRMEALASRAQQPKRSLQFRYDTWRYFTGTRFVSHSGFYSESAGDEATNHAYGGG